MELPRWWLLVGNMNSTARLCNAILRDAPPSRVLECSLSLLLKHGETADGVAKRSAQENIRSKMGGQGEPRKSNEGGRAISSIRNPAVISIAPRNYGSDGEGNYGMTRGK